MSAQEVDDPLPQTAGEAVPALAATLSRLHRALRRQVRAVWPLSALPQSQIEVLRLLHAEPGLRVQDVATMLRLAPNTTSTIVQQLYRHGLLERQPDPRDRRVARLQLTQAAVARIGQWRDARETTLNSAVRALSADDRAALREALPALDRLAERLETLDR